jgi:AraC family transcriptional regulator
MTPARTLGYGQFFGEPAVRHELSGFALARIAATAPPAEVPEHVHETAHVVVVLDGPYLTGAERIEPGRAPALVYNPPGTAHRDRFDGNHGVFFTLSVSDRRLEALGTDRLPGQPVALCSGIAVRLARRLVRDCRVWPPRSTARTEALCADLLGGVAHDAGPSRLRPPRWLAAARETIAARSDEPLSVSELADAAAIHPVHLIRSFRRFFGQTPAAFLRARRIAAAAALLRDSDLPIVEIALRTGFADQSHLTRAFRDEYAMPPAAWRRAGCRPSQPKAG